MNLTIANSPISIFTIVSHGYDDAADELVKYIRLATGIILPLERDSKPNRHEIRLGSPADVCKRLKLDGITNDGFVLKVALGNLLIRSNTEKGVNNGVYEFLHRVLGWRFLCKDVDFLSEPDADVALPDGYTYSFNPVYEYRKSDWVFAQDEAWMAKNHINHNDFHWTRFVHTLAELAETHDQSTQPCLSDESVYEKVLANVRRILDNEPDCKIISVSQNDNCNPCKCEKCLATDKEEGSPSGTLLRFVNRIADEIRDDYPDVSVDTLAYQYTRKAPLITRPRDNVIIRLCSIECCFRHPLNDESCEVNAAFKHDLIEWSKISKRLYIWDYVTDFCHYVPPFPNLSVLRRNLEFFADHHAVGMYPEGNYQSASGEFGELRAYLLARSMWDPHMSDDEYEALKNDFLRGYYGSGWEYVSKFIDFTEKESDGHHMSIWISPFGLISREVYEAHEAEIDSWWETAYSLANEKEKERLDRSVMQWEIVKLYLHPNEEDGKHFAEKLRKYGVRLRECGEIKPSPDFSLPPSEWVG